MPEPGVQSARTRVNFTSAVSLCNVEGEFRILAGIPPFLGKGLFLLHVKLSCVSTFPAERMSPTHILRLLTSSSDWLELCTTAVLCRAPVCSGHPSLNI